MRLKETARRIWDYVVEHEDENITSADIATALDMKRKVVEGTLTRAFQYHDLIERIPAVIYLEDGSAKNIKFIKLTPEGKLFDPDAVEDEEE